MLGSTRESIASAHSIVVKIGSSALTSLVAGLDTHRLDLLADAIEARMRAGSDVVVVSSGAVGAGLAPLGLTKRPRDLATKQAAASVGQLALAHAWVRPLRGTGERWGRFYSPPTTSLGGRNTATLSEPSIDCGHCTRWPSSTKTTLSQQQNSVSVTMTDWPRWWRTWSAQTR